ncbi:MAG: hypothetical protein M3376_11285 [Actinomycetota bacterium]|nr:hypothetical protein [Actinomycetota bacterium]
MSSEPDDRTPAQATGDADASADMEQRLEQLDEHIDDAAKKADAGRPQGDPQSGDPLDDIAGGGTDNEDHVDDPEGPLIGPE